MTEANNVILKEIDVQRQIFEWYAHIGEEAAEQGIIIFDHKNWDEYFATKQTHLDTLSSFKIYLEEQLEKIESLMKQIGFPTITENDLAWSIKNQGLLGMTTPIKQDIKELTKIIGRYE